MAEETLVSLIPRLRTTAGKTHQGLLEKDLVELAMGVRKTTLSELANYID